MSLSTSLYSTIPSRNQLLQRRADRQLIPISFGETQYADVLTLKVSGWS